MGICLLIGALLLIRPANQYKCEECICNKSDIQYINSDIQYINCTHLQHQPSLQPPKDFSKSIETRICIENNTLSSVNNDMFSHFTGWNLTYISFRNSSLHNISEDIFQNLTELKGLDMSFNSIDVDQLQIVFEGIQNDEFNNLDMSNMSISDIPDNLFHPFRTCRTINIHLSHNNIRSFNFKAFENLPGIHFLRLGSNKISNISFPQNFTSNVTSLKLDNNRITTFPNFCKNGTNFPNLVSINFQWNFMWNIEPENFNCLSKLQYFHFNGNLLTTLKSNMLADLYSIEKITLSESFALQHVESSPFNNTNLKDVYFRKNFLYTQNPRCSLNLFEACSSLQLLNIADNILDKTPDSEFDKLFKPLTSLRTLIMGGCRLNRIPPVVMKYLVNLRELVLYNNRIGTWPDGTLDSLTNLDTIYMRQNVITTISEFTFPPNFSRIAYKVDLSDNPFQCTCDLRWFIDWMEKKPDIFIIPKLTSTYKCSSTSYPAKIDLKDLPLSDSICLLDLNSKIITLTGSTMLIVFMVVGSMLYRYRWHIRYFIYMIRYKQRQDVDTGLYEYDAFVAYSNEDRPWVIKTLMPVLEHQASFKLCIHDRDFEVGKLIVDNIVDSIDNSRRLIIILSNTFAKSDWCQFELALIQRHVLENRQRLLVLVMLEEIDTRHVTKSIRAML